MSTEYQLPKFPTAQWVIESLREGPSLTLSQIAAERLDVDQFSFVTFAQENVSQRDLLEFQYGGKAEKADDWLMERLKKNSALGTGQMVVVEDWMATPQSNFIRERGLPAVFFGEEVYYVVRNHDPRTFPHWKRIFTNAVPSFHAFLVNDDAALIEGSTIDHEHLNELGQSLRMIICGAYDGESYVIAEKK